MNLYNRGNTINRGKFTRFFIFTVLLSGIIMSSLAPAYSQTSSSSSPPSIAQLQQQLQETQRELELLQQQGQQGQQQQEQQEEKEPTNIVLNNLGNPCANTGNYLTTFNCGSIDENGTRHFTLIAQENVLVTITDEGQQFLGWTYNATIPGPTMRMTEGDSVAIKVINNGSNSLPHSMHMHSIHQGTMDGVSGEGGAIPPGQSFTYTFTAEPAGVYPYHCHVTPISDHINRGLFGAVIIDPKGGRESMPEMVMVMNGYDLNYEAEGVTEIPDVNITNPLRFVAEEEGGDEERDNEIYTVNGFAFGYMNHPIQLDMGETYRIYLVNMLEFDLVNSFHVHGMMFNYVPSGTVDSSSFVTDILTLGQGDRGMMEMTATQPGQFMFHAHVDEFTQLGWMGMFVVV